MFSPGDDTLSISLSATLQNIHPVLIADIVGAVTLAGKDYPINPNRSEGLYKTITWDGCEERASILWMDAVELLMWTKRGKIHRYIAQYFKYRRLTVYATLHLIVFDHASLTDEQREIIGPVQDALRTQMNMQIVCVNDLKAAAQSIVTITTELLETLNSPQKSPEEYKNLFASILMCIPGMDVCRTELVMSRCPTHRSLRDFLGEFREEYTAGMISLNSSMFTRGKANMMRNVREHWVDNLYLKIVHCVTDKDLYDCSSCCHTEI
ncbi:hypothetical protein PQX77_021217 [Marasmius sp. AFHP31]|nr:hypothetical protein PQX77_021217 [Marasmius sp. AFHP31]